VTERPSWIRPQANRAYEGQLPGALVIERTVLEWRLDPASADRLPFAAYDLHVILVCNEGYASSLAAATLQDLGVHYATDLDGGFRAWKAAGLPVRALPPTDACTICPIQPKHSATELSDTKHRSSDARYRTR
jgi:rhodanese-related sulfurtransferase